MDLVRLGWRFYQFWRFGWVGDLIGLGRILNIGWVLELVRSEIQLGLMFNWVLHLVGLETWLGWDGDLVGLSGLVIWLGWLLGFVGDLLLLEICLGWRFGIAEHLVGQGRVGLFWRFC